MKEASAAGTSSSAGAMARKRGVGKGEGLGFPRLQAPPWPCPSPECCPGAGLLHPTPGLPARSRRCLDLEPRGCGIRFPAAVPASLSVRTLRGLLRAAALQPATHAG
jgi:hypothetical protein